MNYMKKASKSIAIALIGVTISTPVFGMVSAAEKIDTPQTYQNKITTDLDEVADYFSLTDKEKTDLQKSIDEHKEEMNNTAQTRGKTSWIAKAIRKAWRKLPFQVRKTINAYIGLESFLNVIDHFTGTVENVVYKACKKVGMSNDTAWWVTKAITLFV